MPHFTAFFPARETADPRAERMRLHRSHREGLREPSVHEHELSGAWLWTVERDGRAPRVLHCKDGWAVLSGSPVDLDDEPGIVSAERLITALVSGDSTALNRFEGIFAAVAWHDPTSTAFALNDQASNLNLYSVERPDGLWISTLAVPLAVTHGLGLDPGGVREFLARGTLLTPTTMFAGMRRLDMGERLEYCDGDVRLCTHWTPFRQQLPERNSGAAAVALSELAVDRIRRFASEKEAVVSDLTGGYDSRLVATAVSAADRLSAVTVDGPDAHGDVLVAKRVAERMGWRLEHFDTTTFWDVPIDADMRRELTYRVNGELAFTEVYHHLLSRPQLATRYALHTTGGGGELMRSFPWSQEFLGIGRRRRANVENALVYRYFQEGPPTPGLFVSDWHRRVVESFRQRLTGLFDSVPETLTTQQLDAAYLWRMTGFAPYTSAVQGWMRSVAPLMCAQTVDLAIALPWQLRLTSRLVRAIIHRQCPEAAALETRYGGTAGPLRLTHLHRQGWQLLKQGYHLFRKLDRVRLRGALGNVLPPVESDPVVRRPYLTEEFRAFLDPAGLRCRALFHDEPLRALLTGGDDAWYTRERWLLRIATIEQLCRELDWEPGGAFLDD